MTPEEKIARLEARLENTEKALIALIAIAQHDLSEQFTLSTDRMAEEYFEANRKLGSEIGTDAEFKEKP